MAFLCRVLALAAAGAFGLTSPALAAVTPDKVPGAPASYAGYVTPSGSVAAGTGFTAAHTAAGSYTITYPQSKFPAGYPAMTVSGWGENGIVPVAVLYYTKCTSGKTCTFVVNTFSTAGVQTDNGFVFTIVQAK